MKTQQHITSEQQIENQKAEIESLNRKVQSLEDQLQKFLDPDSGEFRPSLHGEKALVEQITSLQKQLDECLETRKVIHDTDLFDRLFNVIGAVLLPPRDDDRYKDINRDLWLEFRRELLNRPDCGRFFSSDAFRKTVSSMSNFIEDLNPLSWAGDPFPIFQSAAENLLVSPNAEGWRLALEALETIEQQQKKDDDLSTYDIQTLRFSMQIILRCALIAEGMDEDIESTKQEEAEV